MARPQLTYTRIPYTTLFRPDRGEGDLRRELAAVLTAPCELHLGAHRPRRGLGEVGGAMLWMHRAYGVWTEGLTRSLHDALPILAEQALRLCIGERDPAVAVDSHDRVRRRLQQPAEL